MKKKEVQLKTSVENAHQNDLLFPLIQLRAFPFLENSMVIVESNEKAGSALNYKSAEAKEKAGDSRKLNVQKKSSFCVLFVHPENVETRNNMQSKSCSSLKVEQGSDMAIHMHFRYSTLSLMLYTIENAFIFLKKP